MDIFSLRRAKEGDSRFVWNLVNDPVVRSVSFSTAFIPWDEHQKWFISKLADSRILFFIVEGAASEKIGQIRFELKDEGWVISISLVDKIRGKGFGLPILRKSLESLSEIHPNSTANAYIKTSNAASIHLFEKAGFIRVGMATIKERDDAAHLLYQN